MVAEQASMYSRYSRILLRNRNPNKYGTKPWAVYLAGGYAHEGMSVCSGDC